MVDSSSNDRTFDVLNSLVNVLVGHERNLDKLITGLSTIMGSVSKKGKIEVQMDNFFEKISVLEKEAGNLSSHLSRSINEQSDPISSTRRAWQAIVDSVSQESHRIILRCVQWKDFQTLAFQAQVLSFIYKEESETLQAWAIKDSQVIEYSGVIPKSSSILKAWLVKQISISEKSVFEGNLNLMK
jgi:hypothetical protein